MIAIKNLKQKFNDLRTHVQDRQWYNTRNRQLSHQEHLE